MSKIVKELLLVSWFASVLLFGFALHSPNVPVASPICSKEIGK